MRLCLPFIPLLLVVAIPAPAGIVQDVKASFATGSDARAIQELTAYRAAQGITPEYLEAFSWLARAEFGSHNYAAAEKFAQGIYAQSTDMLKKRPLDREPHLPLALGAAIEIQAQTLAAQGRRSEAVTFLQEQANMLSATSILPRIRKNLLLLTLEGKPAPPLDGIVRPQGKPALVFFWAHWCPDCKSEVPILAKIKAEFVPQGLTFLAPTQKYGYVAGGVDATPAVETAYIEQVRRTYYSGVIDAPVKVSEANFTRYGASTTPTIVVIDRAGIVRLYHPGAMTYADLRAAVAKVVANQSG
ncbi:MAG TPA: TlpA disulfide reductase family protein, partial [Bryobacteraceae bacterium]|nr:TlpA disulfide reductase family protein [Bryobacteraceae bacterium]